MKYFDVDAYLDGALKGDALEAFEAEMRANPDFAQEVRALQQLTADIEIQTLREQVAAALREDAKPVKKTRARCWGSILGGVLAVALIGYLVWKQTNSHVSTNVPPAQNQPLDTARYKSQQIYDNQYVASVKKPLRSPLKEPSAPKPAVSVQPKKNTDLYTSTYLTPNISGKNKEDKALRTFLEKIWSDKFPPYCMQLGASRFADIQNQLTKRNFSNALEELENIEKNQPPNDTTRLLKGYGLLEIGKGAEALAYFTNLEERQPTWQEQLQWYRCLSVLLMGDTEKTIPDLKKIALTNGHRYQWQSLRLLELIR